MRLNSSVVKVTQKSTKIKCYLSVIFTVYRKTVENINKTEGEKTTYFMIQCENIGTFFSKRKSDFRENKIHLSNTIFEFSLNSECKIS